MSAFDFSGLTNTTTWSDAAFSQDTTNETQGQVVSQTANGSLHAVVASTGGTGLMRAKLTGRTWSGIITAKITLNGTRSFTVTDDAAGVGFYIETGANAWKGYVWRITNLFQRLGILNSTTDNDPSDAPNAWLAAGTTDTIAEGDTFELDLNLSTGALTCKHNGSTLTTVTDTTYSTGLCAGFFVETGNHGGTGVSRLDTVGDSVGGDFVPRMIHAFQPTMAQ